MPKLDGYAATQQIRAAEKGVGRVPIIMLTSEADVEQRVRGLRAGADDDIVKPFHPLELMARIKALLAQTGGRRSPKAGHRGADARQAVRLLSGQGRRGHHHHRHQHRHRAGPRAEAPDRADRRQPPVRRPARLPGPGPRHRLDRERDQRARPRPGPVPDHDGQPPVRDRPPAGPAHPGGRRHRGRAPATGARRHHQHARPLATPVRLHPGRHVAGDRRLQPPALRRGRCHLRGHDRRPVVPEERAARARDDGQPRATSRARCSSS